MVTFSVLFIFKRRSNNGLSGPRQADLRAAKPILPLSSLAPGEGKTRGPGNEVGKMGSKIAHLAKKIRTDLPCSLQRFVY